MNIKNFAISCVTATVLVTSAGSLKAQTPPDQTPPPATVTNDDDRRDDFDWGWIGLLGLAGLAGLAGRPRRDIPTTRTTPPRT
jgi:hypothetical protein